MPIPKHKESGILPPFLGDEPGRAKADQTPYRVTIEEVVARFGTSQRRREILRGFLSYRRTLRSVGITLGVMWVDGSFIDVMKREPGDIDMILLVEPPLAWQAGGIPAAHQPIVDELLSPSKAKAKYLCEVFVIDLSNRGLSVAREVAYWFSLFSHQRETFAWRGTLELAIASPDDDAGAEGLITLMEKAAEEEAKAAAEASPSGPQAGEAHE